MGGEPKSPRRLLGTPFLPVNKSTPERGRRGAAILRSLQDVIVRKAERDLNKTASWSDRQRVLKPLRQKTAEEFVRLVNLAMASAGRRLSLADVLNPETPLSPELLLVMSEVGRNMSGDAQFAFNTGAVLVPAAGFRVRRALGVPRALLQLGSVLRRTGAGRLQLLGREGRSVHVRWDDREEVLAVPEAHRNAYIRYGCETARGAVASLPAVLFGLPAAHVEETACRALGADRCEWEVGWEARPLRVTRNRFGLGGVVAVAVLAYELLGGPGTGPAGLLALPALPLVLGWLWQRVADNNELLNRLQERSADLESTLTTLKDTQRQVVEAEKMASLGQLTAGVAHEINNPVNFLASSVPSLRRDIDQLLDLLRPAGGTADIGHALQDLPLLEEEIRELLDGMEEGARRTSEIVRGLRTFARVDETDMKKVDLRENIDTTLMLLRERYYPRIEIDVVTDPENGVVVVEGNAGQLNQVFMNVLVNAMEAIAGAGHIRIEMAGTESAVTISIWDSGPAIPDGIKSRIFEPFFTTKPVGEGTGLGLSISYAIVERHHGRLSVENAPAGGVRFTIVLPVSQPASAAAAETG